MLSSLHIHLRSVKHTLSSLTGAFPERMYQVASTTLPGDQGSLKRAIGPTSFAVDTQYAEVAVRDRRSAPPPRLVLVLATPRLIDGSLVRLPCIHSDVLDGLSLSHQAYSSALLP